MKDRLKLVSIFEKESTRKNEIEREREREKERKKERKKESTNMK